MLNLGISGTSHFPAAMYTEKRDYLIFYAVETNNRACKAQAVQKIGGFLPSPPTSWQPSYAAKQRVWRFQMDIVDYYQRIIGAAKLRGNMVQTITYFRKKYPVQITDFDKELGLVIY